MTDDTRCALHGIDQCPLCIPLIALALAKEPPASQFNIAIGTDGNPLPFSPDEVKQVASKAVDQGDLLAVLIKLPTGDLSFQVFGPPSRELVDMLEGAVVRYEARARVCPAVAGGTAIVSKQFEHLQEQSLRRLKALVPSDVPLVVRRVEGGGFLAETIDGKDGSAPVARFQVVAAWISGYVAASRRLRPTRCAERWAGHTQCVRPEGHIGPHLTATAFDWV